MIGGKSGNSLVINLELVSATSLLVKNKEFQFLPSCKFSG